MDNPGSCNTDSFLGNHPNKILIMKSTIHICTECQVPREEGGGCYIFCNGKNFLPIPEEKPQNIQDVVGENWAEDAYYL